MSYDSKEDTLEHIALVRKLLEQVTGDICQRIAVHDASKLQEPEKSMFDEWRPKLDAFEYGTSEYMDAVAGMGTAINHHYEHNSHHPEYYEDGINDMTLLDLLEMLADWKAASMRRNDGNMKTSLEFGVERFNINPSLLKTLTVTANELGWLAEKAKVEDK